MYNPDTEILFPLRVVPQLKSLRGGEWAGLVDLVSSPESDKAQKYAFVLMMVKMSGCVNCDSDSFRAMRGCSQCARQSVRRFRGTDQDLLDQHLHLQKEVEAFLKKQNGQ